MGLFRIYALVALLNITMYMFVIAEESGLRARNFLYTIHTGFLITALARSLRYLADPGNYGGNPTVMAIMGMVMLFTFEGASCYYTLLKISNGTAQFSAYSWFLAICVLYERYVGSPIIVNESLWVEAFNIVYRAISECLYVIIHLIKFIIETLTGIENINPQTIAKVLGVTVLILGSVNQAVRMDILYVPYFSQPHTSLSAPHVDQPYTEVKYSASASVTVTSGTSCNEPISGSPSQFGSNIGFMNGTPPCTSSVPPNLDKQNHTHIPPCTCSAPPNLDEQNHTRQCPPIGDFDYSNTTAATSPPKGMPDLQSADVPNTCTEANKDLQSADVPDITNDMNDRDPGISDKSSDHMLYCSRNDYISRYICIRKNLLPHHISERPSYDHSSSPFECTKDLRNDSLSDRKHDKKAESFEDLQSADEPDRRNEVNDRDPGMNGKSSDRVLYCSMEDPILKYICIRENLVSQYISERSSYDHPSAPFEGTKDLRNDSLSDRKHDKKAESFEDPESADVPGEINHSTKGNETKVTSKGKKSKEILQKAAIKAKSTSKVKKKKSVENLNKAKITKKKSIDILQKADAAGGKKESVLISESTEIKSTSEVKQLSADSAQLDSPVSEKGGHDKAVSEGETDMSARNLGVNNKLENEC